MSNTLDTATYKSIHGWKSETVVHLADLENGKKRELKIYTMKSGDGYLTTRAMVHESDGKFQSHAMFQDFSVVVERSNTRATQGSVAKQQERVLLRLDEIKAQAVAHYADKKAS